MLPPSNNKNFHHRCKFLVFFALIIQATITCRICHGFIPPSMMTASSSIYNSNHRQLFYKDEHNISENTNNSKGISSNEKIGKVKKRKKPIVEDVKGLDDLRYLLDGDDDRLVAVKFYAPWCKMCQYLGKSFDRLATEMADTIVDRQIVRGKIRCAEVECRSKNTFATEQLYVMGLPTLHLYYGTNKIWECSGQTNTQELRKVLSELDGLLPEELQAHAESTDDGILTNALEDTTQLSYPSFLDEEW